MLNTLTFGKFLTLKRQELGYTIREFSKMLALSPAYVCGMEKGKKPAPSPETQMKIAQALSLTESEEELLFDLAVMTKREGTIPGDVWQYILMDGDILMFLRDSKRKRVKGEDLLKLIPKQK